MAYPDKLQFIKADQLFPKFHTTATLGYSVKMLGDQFKVKKVLLYKLTSEIEEFCAMGSCKSRWYQQTGMLQIHGQQINTWMCKEMDALTSLIQGSWEAGQEQVAKSACSS